MRKLILGLIIALSLMVAPTVFAATACTTYSDTGVGAGKFVGPLQGVSTLGYSIQVFITAGSGTVGSYQAQISDVTAQSSAGPEGTVTGIGYANTGSAVSSAAAPTVVSTIAAQWIRLIEVSAPGSGTTVQVCLYVAGTP